MEKLLKKTPWDVFDSENFTYRTISVETLVNSKDSKVIVEAGLSLTTSKLAAVMGNITILNQLKPTGKVKKLF